MASSLKIHQFGFACPGGGNGIEAVARKIRATGAVASAVLEAGKTRLRAVLLNRRDLGVRIGETARWVAAPEDTVVLPADR